MPIRGFSTPLRLDTNSRFVVTQDVSKLIDNAKNILRTLINERWYEPNNGVPNFSSILFSNPDHGGVGKAAASEFQLALETQEPRCIWTVTYLGVSDKSYGTTAEFLVQLIRKDSTETGSFTYEVNEDA